jgi:hypothetical protein
MDVTTYFAFLQHLKKSLFIYKKTLFRHRLLFYLTSYLKEEVNCTQPSPLLRIPSSKKHGHIISNFSVYLDGKKIKESEIER